MKKILIFFLCALLFWGFAFSVCAEEVTTTPQESTGQSVVPDGYEDGMVREVDISGPVAACLIAVSAFIVYGIVKLKKTKTDGPEL
ncbi:MAG: hypothetical protein IJW21_09775 [Clostridia bacterium]|nr:hypothetical protein [Clostridia bacterium]